MRIPIQPLKSSKLFYNKWPYKIACSIRGASILRHIKGERLEACMPNWAWGSGKKMTIEEKRDLIEFTTFIEPFLKLKEELQVRVEGDHFNIFCKDRLLLDNISNALDQWIVKIHGPTTEKELKFLLVNGHKKIVCDVLPKDKYQYRIYLKSEKWTTDKRHDFLMWVDKFNDKIDIATTTRRWLKGEKQWAYAPFMYVNDDKMLAMVGLYISGHVRKVEEFILRENALVA